MRKNKGIMIYPTPPEEALIRRVVAMRGGRKGDLNNLILEGVVHYIMDTTRCPLRTNAIRQERRLDEDA